MSPYIDLHTHQLRQEKDVISVYNLLLHENSDIPLHPFSAGLHPWYAGQLSTAELSRVLDQFADNQNLVAFGETGLDKACRIPLKLQLDAFGLHLDKAAEHKKPLILHCVKAWDELIEITTGYPVVKILHGYNGSAQLTDRLLQHGFQFSIGKAILQPDAKILSALRLIPLSAIFCETDNSEVSIQHVYEGVSASLQMNEEELRAAIFTNFTKLSSELK